MQMSSCFWRRGEDEEDTACRIYPDDIAALYGDDDVIRTYVVHLGDQPSMDGDEVHCSYSQMLDSVVENVNDILNNIES